MNVIAFKQSLTENNPPKNLSDNLKALWHARKGDWDKAHNIVQELEDKNASGYTRFCIEKKVILAMLIIGIVVPIKKDLTFLWKKNGAK